MKKYILIFLMAVITLSFCGCNTTTTRDMIGSENGVAYFDKPKNTPEITFTYTSETETPVKETKIEDASFCDKLIAAIDGKPALDEFCHCAGDYQVTIDNEYLFYLHGDRIVVFTDIKRHTGFTVECSKEETKKLYDIIEATN